jgi:hypothetical protein
MQSTTPQSLRAMRQQPKIVLAISTPTCSAMAAVGGRE